MDMYPVQHHQRSHHRHRGQASLLQKQWSPQASVKTCHLCDWTVLLPMLMNCTRNQITVSPAVRAKP